MKESKTERELLETVLLALIDSQRQLSELRTLMEQNTAYTLRGKQVTLNTKDNTIRASKKVSKRLEDVLENVLDKQFESIHQLVLVKIFKLDKAILKVLTDEFQINSPSNTTVGGILGLIMARKSEKIRQLLSRSDFCWSDRANESDSSLIARNAYRVEHMNDYQIEEAILTALKNAKLNDNLSRKIYEKGKRPV